jgi:hypothetical protein
MKTQTLAVTSFSLTVVIAVVCLILVSAGTWKTLSQRSSSAQAGNLEMPTVVDIGSVANGSIVPVAIRISNRGLTRASMSGFHASCACMRLYTLRDTAKLALSSLVIEPSSSDTIYADLMVAGDPGMTQATVVAFRESGADEDTGLEYRVGIKFTPLARIYAVPKMIAFGDVAEGAHSSQRVELRSDGTFDGDLGELSCSSPALFSVEYQKASVTERREFGASLPGQHLLGFLNVSIKPTAHATKIHEQLSIMSNGRELCTLPVSARPISEFVLAPSTVVLPRIASQEVAYASSVRCIGRSADRFEIVLISKSEPFSIDVRHASDSAGLAVIGIRYDGGQVVSDRREYVLDFMVTARGVQRRVSLPVIVLPNPS